MSDHKDDALLVLCRQLTQLAAVETDPTKLTELVIQINQLLDVIDARVNSQPAD